MWKRGFLIESEKTKKMSRMEIDQYTASERMQVFSDFSIVDKGQSRRVVCIMNPLHMDYDKNVALIEAAPDILKALKESYDHEDFTTPSEATQATVERLKAAGLWE